MFLTTKVWVENYGH
ncbi:hypothetical protein ACNVD4_10305, partial [Rhizobium sp. BR5]